MKTNKPVKWEDIKIGQDYYTEQRPHKRITKLADKKIRLHLNNRESRDMDIDVVSKCKYDNGIVRCSFCNKDYNRVLWFFCFEEKDFYKYKVANYKEVMEKHEKLKEQNILNKSKN